MKRATHLLALALLLSSFGAAAAQQGGGFDLSWNSIGGESVAGGGFTLIGDAGRSDGTNASGGTYDLAGGFVPGICHGRIEAYGVGCSGLGGYVPELAVRGCPEAGDQIVLELDQGVGGAITFLMLGTGRGSAALGQSGCLLYTVPLIPGLQGPLVLSPGGAGAGSISIPAPVTADIPPGFLLTMQAILGDASTVSGFTVTNGVELIFS